MKSYFNIAVIGGGINGCGIAADAAMRGLDVLLIESDDLASKTSSASSKLIHGGLRYLEHYHFALVQKSLQERQTLLHVAAHLVRPLPIVLPIHPAHRSRRWLRVGFFLYDHLIRSNTLPRSRPITRQKHPCYFHTIQAPLQQAYVFYDGRTHDARLAITNALQAQQHGATIRTHTELLEGQVHHDHWRLTLQSQDSIQQVEADVVINATGPWTNHVNHRLNMTATATLTLVKGSHILVHKWYPGDHAYLLQQTDHRVIFVIPSDHDMCYIGTTEVVLDTIPRTLSISEEEIDYLLAGVAPYFDNPPRRTDIQHHWSGIRPLATPVPLHQTPEPLRETQHLSREYMIHHTRHPAPAVVIYGGKITTYRQLAEETIDGLRSYFPHLPPSKTATTMLPGADLPPKMTWDVYQAQLQQRYPWLATSCVERLLHTYGTRATQLLDGCTQATDMGTILGHGLTAREVLYLCEYEWAECAEDILWRRTSLGYVFTSEETAALQAVITDNKRAKITSTLPTPLTR